MRDGFTDYWAKSPYPNDTCFVADDNIVRAESQSAAARALARAAGSADWDHKSPPRYLDRVDSHLHLTGRERSLLYQNGFVVLDRLPYVSYAAAFHDIFQEQLPLYVGVDPILHAVFRATEHVLRNLEKQELRGVILRMLRKLRGTLAASGNRYAETTRRDLDIYLGVAWALAQWDSPSSDSLFGQRSEIEQLVRDITKAEGLGDPEAGVELFGRRRVIDYSQFAPRGHYDEQDGSLEGMPLSSYFRTMMWLARLEFNLISRSCRSSQPGVVPNPSETPREARDAVALADLVQRSGASSELARLEQVYSSFGGFREDVSIPALGRLVASGGIGIDDEQTVEKLRAVVGNRFHRTARTHFMPQNSPELPVILTLLGPRIVPDIAPLTQLVHDRIDGRLSLSAADVAFVLGHDRARRYLEGEIGRYPSLPEALEKARATLAANTRPVADAYSSWLRGILALGHSPGTTAPSFMRTAAYDDARMNSALVGYGQVRHVFVLLAGQGYDAYGCEIPDAYVEPLPAVFGELARHARVLAQTSKEASGLLRVLRMLDSIVRTEAGGRALSEPQRRWLAMVSEFIPSGGYGGDSGVPPTWTGWYYDMFADREKGATKTASFVADYMTLTNLGEAAYLGNDGIRLGVFVVDVGGEPRAMVGPVAKGYELHTGLAQRWSDEKVLEVEKKPGFWRASYAALPEAPSLPIEGAVVRCGSSYDGPSAVGFRSPRTLPGKTPEWRAAIRATQAKGRAAITLLDHHGDPLTEPLSLELKNTWTTVAFSLPDAVAEASHGVEAFDIVVENAQGDAYHHFTTPSVMMDGEPRGETDGEARRPSGTGAFSTGKKLTSQAVDSGTNLF